MIAGVHEVNVLRRLQLAFAIFAGELLENTTQKNYLNNWKPFFPTWRPNAMVVSLPDFPRATQSLRAAAKGQDLVS